MPVRALFFDFDGVLWDSEVAALQSWQETFAEHGQRMPLDVFATMLGTLGGKDPIDELEGFVGSPIDREAIARIAGSGRWNWSGSLRPRPGVLGYIEEAFERGSHSPL
jgi:beta-phosphoglucomutase-like phosphatase (HAD superfamily)